MKMVDCHSSNALNVELTLLKNYKCLEAGLILVTYCRRYPHAMPLLWNKMPYFLLKFQKCLLFRGEGVT